MDDRAVVRHPTTGPEWAAFHEALSSVEGSETPSQMELEAECAARRWVAIAVPVASGDGAALCGAALLQTLYSTWTGPYLWLSAVWAADDASAATLLAAAKLLAAPLKWSRVQWYGNSTALPPALTDADVASRSPSAALPQWLSLDLDICGAASTGAQFAAAAASKAAAVGITLRAAEREDMAFVLQQIHELAVFEREPDAVDVSLAQMLNWGGFDCDTVESKDAPQPPLFRVFVAALDGTGAVAFALVSPMFDPVHGSAVYLEDLYVDPAARGKGVGSALIARCIRYAAEEGAARLRWMCLDWNSAALDFYTANVGVVDTGLQLRRVSRAERAGRP